MTQPHPPHRRSPPPQDQDCKCTGTIKVTKCPEFILAKSSGTCELANSAGARVTKATGDRKKGEKAANDIKPHLPDTLAYEATVECKPKEAAANCVVRVTAKASWKDGEQDKSMEFGDPKAKGHGLKGFL